MHVSVLIIMNLSKLNVCVKKVLLYFSTVKVGGNLHLKIALIMTTLKLFMLKVQTMHFFGDTRTI